MSIPLHPKRGLDPHLTFCPFCGGDADAGVAGLEAGDKILRSYPTSAALAVRQQAEMAPKGSARVGETEVDSAVAPERGKNSAGP